jgi:hypothetical protein
VIVKLVVLGEAALPGVTAVSWYVPGRSACPAKDPVSAKLL